LQNQKKFLSISTVVQQNLYWCWAAVGAACANFLKPDVAWTQCKLASQSIVPAPGNCCQKKNDKCNVEWYLVNDEDGKNEGSFITTGIANGYVEGAIAFKEVVANIDKGLPLAYRLENKKLPIFTHFVFLSGYEIKDGKQLVRINDSAGGITSEIEYSIFAKNYNGEDKVTHTFFLKSI
jgi:hypothetical protein